MMSLRCIWFWTGSQFFCPIWLISWITTPLMRKSCSIWRHKLVTNIWNPSSMYYMSIVFKYEFSYWKNPSLKKHRNVISKTSMKRQWNQWSDSNFIPLDSKKFDILTRNAEKNYTTRLNRGQISFSHKIAVWTILKSQTISCFIWNNLFQHAFL